MKPVEKEATMDIGRARLAQVMDFFDSEGVHYSDVSDEEKPALRVRFGGPNFNTDITVRIFFDADGCSVCIVVPELAHVPQNKADKAVLACNGANNRFRWVSCYLDEDNDIEVQMDAIVDERTVGPICLEAIRRVASIADEVFPMIMKALWAD